MASSFTFENNGAVYVYYATYPTASWTGNATSGFTQTVTPIAVKEGSPAVNSTLRFGPPMTTTTGVKATDANIVKALSFINAGHSTTNDNGTVTTVCWSKPAINITVYWYGTTT